MTFIPSVMKIFQLVKMLLVWEWTHTHAHMHAGKHDIISQPFLPEEGRVESSCR